jgi:hypothetical protein
MSKRKRSNKTPNIINVNNELYYATVFLIHTKHQDGTPALCKLMKDDSTIDLEGGGEFMIAYVPGVMLKDKEP